MGLILINKNEVPPGGFTYFQAETRHRIHAPSWPDLIRQVKDHRRANNLPIGLQIEQEIEQQLCESLPPERVKYDNPADRKRASLFKFPSAEVMKSFLQSAVAWGKSGFHQVSPEEAQARANVCLKCPFRRQAEGCTGCNMGELVGQLRVLFPETGLKASDTCGICYCALAVKVHLPIEVIRKGETPEQQEAYPEYCWLKDKNAENHQLLEKVDAHLETL